MLFNVHEPDRIRFYNKVHKIYIKKLIIYTHHGSERFSILSFT